MTTVARLHKMLGDLIAAGHGRKPVCIDKASFYHPLEQDGATIIDISGVAGPKFICKADDDGGQAFNKDGTEAGRMTVILFGSLGDKP